MNIDFITIIRYAWMEYDPTRTIKSIEDISVHVSTNHVYMIRLEDGNIIIAKLSYFGRYEHFVEDHTIINSLSNNLPYPFENFLSRSLMKGDSIFFHRFQNNLIDAWVVFYRPIKIAAKLPRKLDTIHIEKLGEQFAFFHRACDSIRHTLPKSSKTLNTDIEHLLEILNSEFGKFEHRLHVDEIKKQCDRFFENIEELNYHSLAKIPVFVDWNIGNFSLTENLELFSRWDYDWFRMCSRMMDFYFMSRIVSEAGDRTVFSYNVETLMEDRFLHFLKHYHAINPLTEPEVRVMKETYRFFILNYVIKDGRYFFHEIYATKLQKEAYEIYFPAIDNFDPSKILKALKI